MTALPPQWENLSKRFGEMAKTVLVRDEMAAEMRGTILQIQNDLIEEKLGGLQAAFAKAIEAGKGVPGDAAALTQEYQQLLAHESSLSPQDDERLEILDNMKSDGAELLAKGKDGVFYDNVGMVMATIIDPSKRGKLDPKYNVQRFPEARSAFVSAAMSAQATARLRLANDVLQAYEMQGGAIAITGDISARVQAWQSHNAAWGVPRDHQALSAFLHNPEELRRYGDAEENKALKAAYRDIASGDAAAAVASKHQMIDMTGNILVAMVIENPELLRKRAVKKAVKAMKQLEDVQLEEAISVTPRMNASEKALFKVEMRDVLVAHKSKHADRQTEEAPSSLFGKLAKLVTSGVERVLKLMGAAVDKVSPFGGHSYSDRQKAADDILRGVAVATEQLAKGDRAIPPESVDAIGSFLIKVEEQMGLDPLRTKLMAEMEKAHQQAEKSQGR